MPKVFQRKIWLHSIFIVGFGLIALYSASFQNSRITQEVFFDQCWGALLGFLIMYLLSRVDYRKFYDAAYFFYFLNILLLFFVLIGGRHALGARRWLEVGSLSFQPSELTKFFLILMLARYFSSRRVKLSFNLLSRAQRLWRDLIFPLVLTSVPIFFIFKQPDLGTALLILGIFLIMVFVSAIDYRLFFAFLFFILSFLPFGWHFLKPYQKDRLLVFLNPNIDPLGAGYTIIQSKIAVGSGQLTGKGWLAGTQNQLNFLPERHTDFIFSVIGEEWGLIGALFLFYCYWVIIDSGFQIAQKTNDQFGRFLAIGIMGVFSLQVIINVGMVLGLLPVVGLTLPLVSFGRTSFLIFMAMLGVLLNLNKKI